MNSIQTDDQEGQVPSEIPKITWLGELPLFLFLACLANPFAFIGPYRFPQIFLCLCAWLILSRRYSIQELCKQLGSAPARLLRWVYFGTLIITGFQFVVQSEPNPLHPARYSFYHYEYGVTYYYDEEEGGGGSSASHVITKGPYRVSQGRRYDGYNVVPRQVNGEELEGSYREDFFFWEASGTEMAKKNVSLPARVVFYLLNELIRYTIIDFILICVILAGFSFHPKGRSPVFFLAESLRKYRAIQK